MCSITAILKIHCEPEALRAQAVEMSHLQRHRGPDWSGVWLGKSVILAHERLAIVDPLGGEQPLLGPRPGLALAVNGEIYNHAKLEGDLKTPYEFTTNSDCEVLLPLYIEHGAEFVDRLSGIFAFVLVDEANDRFLIARDPFGVIPLYWGHDAEGRLLVVSEMKAIVGRAEDFEPFPPGHVYDSRSGRLERYYLPTWTDYGAVEGAAIDHEQLAEALDDAVKRQLMSDVPYGVLLSGGLDSSLTSVLAARHSHRRIEDDERSEAWWPNLHSFAIGLAGSPDLAAARRAAEAIGSVHHDVVYSFEQGLDAIPEVIRHLETYDVTTIRAATPMYLLARRIKAMGIKMVLTGEGSDEIFGGYLYFHKAPNAREFHEECVRKLSSLHLYDCLRANKSMAAWGVEARVPFLDREFVDVAMGFDSMHKMCVDGRIEKHCLRKAFDGFLPPEILWRQKEQFSDGVGYGWIDGLKDHAEAQVGDDELDGADERFPDNPPATKEGYFYRRIFEGHFPGRPAARTVPGGKTVACSTETALAWDAAFAELADPSGRAVRGVHNDAYDRSGER